jgi:AcrR family transcriptional regulator
MADVDPAAEGRGRRTQARRSAETIEQLLLATTASIADHGYHRATTARICQRAGVSPGALFHHFDTKVDLVLAALRRLLEMRIDRYLEFAASVRTTGAPDGGGLELLRMARSLTRDPEAMVWLEVTMAARADAELRARLRPLLAARWRSIRDVASRHPAIAAMPVEPREAWLQILWGTLELDAIWEHVIPGDELDERKDRALLALAVRLGRSH